MVIWGWIWLPRCTKTYYHPRTIFSKRKPAVNRRAWDFRDAELHEFFWNREQIRELEEDGHHLIDKNGQCLKLQECYRHEYLFSDPSRQYNDRRGPSQRPQIQRDPIIGRYIPKWLWRVGCICEHVWTEVNITMWTWSVLSVNEQILIRSLCKNCQTPFFYWP